MKKVLFLLLVLLSACRSKPPVPFKILTSVKTDGSTKMDVQINNRLSKPQMIAIAAYIKSDSSQYSNLQIDYLLPGNNVKNTGGLSVYATVAYHSPDKVTAADTIKDADNNQLSFEFIGYTADQAKHLLSFNPPDTIRIMMVGKFIDDNTHTVTLIYQDRKDENQTHIIEMDPDGKVVAAIVPTEVTYKGIRKMVISNQGDYMVLKDSLLTMYSSTDYDKPYRSIKEGL